MLVKPYDPPSPIVNHLYGWFMTLLYYALLTIWKITTFHWWFNYQWAMFNRKLTSKKRLRVFEPLNQQLFVSSKRLEGFPAACKTKLRVRWSWHPSHGPQNRLRDFFFLVQFGDIFSHFSWTFHCFFAFGTYLFFFALIVQRFCFFCFSALLPLCFSAFLLLFFFAFLLLCLFASLFFCRLASLFFTVLNALVCIYIYIYTYKSGCIYI